MAENARRDMVLTLEDMGFEIEASHHEASPGQHEIDFRYEPALHAADNIMTFKLAVKTIANATACMPHLCRSQRVVSVVLVCISICHCAKTAEIFLQMKRTDLV